MARNPELRRLTEMRYRHAHPERIRTRVNAYRKRPGNAAKHSFANMKVYYKNKSRKLVDFMLARSKTQAKYKGLRFDLTKKWLRSKLETGACERTGIRFVLEGKNHLHTPSIDRIDSTKGYVKTNCQVVVWIYNVSKNRWADADVLVMAKALVRKAK